MAKLAAGLLLVSLCCCTAAAQPITIRRDSASSTPLPNTFALVEPIRCDADGNIYFRAFAPPHGQSPLVRLSADGRTATYYSIDAAAEDGVKEPTPVSFAVHPDSDVYQLVKDVRERVFLLEFSKTGEYKKAIALDRQFAPAQFTVLGREAFLISGTTSAKRELLAGESTVRRPFVAIFDRNGRFVRNLTLSGEEAPDQKADEAAAIVDLGLVESGAEGAYVLWGGGKPTLYMISVAGSVERRFELEAPDKTIPGSLRVGSGQILVRYYEPVTKGTNPAWFLLYENLEGRKLAEFIPASDLIGAFACFDWRSTFVFLGTDKHGAKTIVSGVAGR